MLSESPRGTPESSSTWSYPGTSTASSHCASSPTPMVWQRRPASNGLPSGWSPSSVWWRSSRPQWPPSSTGRRVRPLPGLLSALALICLGFYARGSLGSLVALFVTPQIRTWSRFVVLIGLLGLLVVGLALTWAGAQRGRRIVWPLAAVVTLLGVLDQTSPAAAPHYEALRQRAADLAAYTGALHREVGDCPVFQLPVVAFPEEPPPGRMGDYDHLLPSTFAPAGLSWSYGAIRGTAHADWQLALPVARTPQLLDDIAAAGFCAVEVDRDGYAGGDDPSADIQDIVGAPVASADAEARDAYDLRQLPASRSRRDAVLRPVVASAAGSLIDTSGPDPFQWTGPSTVVTVANMGTAPRPLTLTFRLEGNGPARRTVAVTAPGVQRTVTVSANRSELVSLSLTVPPGSTRVKVSTDSKAASVPGTAASVVAALRLSNLRVDAHGAVNAASLQEFAAASPRSHR